MVLTFCWIGMEEWPSRCGSRNSERDGYLLPSRIGIEDLPPVLENTPKLTPGQIAQFMEEAGKYAGD
jgi:hypothetical protein